MRLLYTEEQKVLIDKFKPYLNERYELMNEAPDDIKLAFEKFRKLREEQWKFAQSL